MVYNTVFPLLQSSEFYLSHRSRLGAEVDTQEKDADKQKNRPELQCSASAFQLRHSPLFAAAAPPINRPSPSSRCCCFASQQATVPFPLPSPRLGRFLTGRRSLGPLPRDDKVREVWRERGYRFFPFIGESWVSYARDLSKESIGSPDLKELARSTYRGSA